jgi:hypothetical protein
MVEGVSNWTLQVPKLLRTNLSAVDPEGLKHHD